MARILVYDAAETHGDWKSLLVARGREVLVCAGRESFVAALAERRPDVLVYVIADLADDLGLLFALRRLASELPIILLGGPTDLGARRSIQELRPTYYGVLPLEDSELDEVVRGALGRTSTR